MKQLIWVLVLFFLGACNNNSQEAKSLIGKWKIYKTVLDNKDISKSSDPSNENGIEFKADGQYVGFGNPGHQGAGTYELKDNVVIFKSELTPGNTEAEMTLEQDTLHLKMLMDGSKPLSMSLYRMD